MISSAIERMEAGRPTVNDSELAKESSQHLSQLLGGLRLGEGVARDSEPVKIEIRLDGEQEVVALPASALQLLNEILIQMAAGNAISIVPQKYELTTVQAAEMLNVSRPYLITMLDKRQIPYRLVGTHRRIQLEDVLNFKRDLAEKRLNALRELSELSEELGMDD